jgi:uncharacterized repeat protein (TIGR03847 family)
MPPIVHGFDWPDRVVVGTVGAPGERSFYLQARDGARIVAVALEKQQAQALAEKIDELLDALADADDTPISIPSGTPAELVDTEPLDQPIDSQFRTGTISLGWDPATAQIIIEAFPIVEVDDEADAEEIERLENAEPDELLVIRIPVGTARAFAKRSLEIVAAGRS